MFRNALVSVSDKTGLLEFLQPLAQQGMRVVSTGGTARYLKENGIAVVDISEQTGFPEVMDGRVKTLHPRVHMALLARSSHPEDLQILAKEGLQPFDLVVGNLYPFAQAAAKFRRGEVSELELIENIDIGGPSFLRSAAKSFERIAVVCDPADYAWVLKRPELTLADRKRLAGKVYAHTSCYDSLVAKELGLDWRGDWSLAGHAHQDLRYGENPHQRAAWFRRAGDTKGLATAQILQGKSLSYNNILDLDAAAKVARQLHLRLQKPTAVAVKHNNPCGAAIDVSAVAALRKCLAADPVSVFGGVIALSFAIDQAVANQLVDLFLECVVAPSVTDEAKEILARKKNLRVLIWDALLEEDLEPEVRSVHGGFLVQDADPSLTDPADWKILGESPSADVLEDLVFSEIVVAGLKSNSICLVKGGATVGLGMGQVNRVEAVQHAVDRMLLHHGKIEGVVLASDAFFPFADGIEKAADHHVKWILQPGGSMRDEEVFATAKKRGLNVVLNGARHFRH